MYVAITRARERLFFTRSLSRYLYGERSTTLRSRFLTELASELGIEENSRRGGYSGQSDYGYAGAARRSYGGYAQGGYGSRSSYRYNASREEEEYGYQSDLPASASSFSPAAGFGGARAASGQSGSKPKSFVAPHASASSKDYSKFRPGVRVRHAKFGEGMIVDTKGAGSALVLNVSFAGLGIKQLSAQLAPLEIIG